MKTATAPSYPVQIFVAGDLADARRICREHCMKFGLCVTVTPTEYVYTGGMETGVIVGLINYPRFPAEPSVITVKALALADDLMVGLSQWSATIQTPDTTHWITRRPGEASPSEAA